MGNNRFNELVSGFLQQNELVLAQDDPSELVITVSNIRVRLHVLDDSDDALYCVAEFLDEATRVELTSQSALQMALKLNFETHRAEDFHFAIDPQGQPVLMACFVLSTLATDELTAIVTQALDSAALFTLIVTAPHERNQAGLDFSHYSLRA